MALHYNGTTIGKVVIKQNVCDEWKKFTIQIRQGNCLAVLINVRKLTPDEMAKHPGGRYMHTLYTFYCDSTHMEKLIKHEGDVLFDKVVSIELNMYYKECRTLLKYFTLAEHTVKCYFKAPKTKKSK